jgi:hypothetical protein|tara:strand:+ start:269 stop:697 length:429 start_codon:yes stop_codon:yes gene_type:complete
MSRRTKLLEQLLQTDTFGEEAKDQKEKMRIVSELILCDMVDIALNGVEKHGAGSLFINLIDGNRESVYMSGFDIEKDLALAESSEDEDTVKMLRQVLEKVDENDWNTHVVFTFITHDGTRTYSVEAGGSTESLRALTAEFTG